MFFPAPHEPIVKLRQMHTAAEGLDHPEGIATDPDGSLWAGGEVGQLYRIRDGQVEVIAQLGGFCLGITVSPKGQIVVCNTGLHSLQFVSRAGKLLREITEVDGHKLVTPNFSVFDDNGDLYFSDSGHWNGFDGHVYVVRAGGSVEHFAGPFHFANGLCMSQNCDSLFVVESQRDRVMRVPIARDGSAGEPAVYAEGLARIPDGIAFDEAGNLFVTCYATDCIYRVSAKGIVELFAFDPEGTLLARPTNIAFGGHDRKTMFVANLGRWHITGIPNEHPGMLLAGQVTA